MRELLRVTTLVADGKLPTERALSERFGVGRREIRRALEVLEAEGLIWRKQGAGTFLGQRPDSWSDHAASLVTGTNFMEIMEVRLRLEPQLAQLAALRARDADIERMRALRDKIYERTDADWRELWDGSLHRLIAQSAGNQLFLSLFDVINRVRQDPFGSRCANVRASSIKRCVNHVISTPKSSRPSLRGTLLEQEKPCARTC